MRRHSNIASSICVVLALFWGTLASAPAGHALEVPASGDPSQATARPVLEQQDPPSVQAKSGILVDALDGRILWEKSSNRQQAVASTGKILTALVVLDNARPSETVTASPRAQLIGDADPLVTQLNLTAGEELTVEQLLYGLLLASANDAAVALAEHVGGSNARFVEMMNAKAKDLGAKNSNFTNANGLDDPGQYSTAHDLALFAREAMQHPLFRKIVGTRSRSIPDRGRSGGRALQNRNQLLGRFPGATGIKTGQTLAAGRSLVGAARRDGEERIVVILASPDPVDESQDLLEYGLSAFRRFRLAEKSRRWGEITYGDGTTARLTALRSVSTLLPASQPDPEVFFDPQRKVLSANPGAKLQAPVKVKCIPDNCRLPPDPQKGLFPAFMSVLAPLLSLAR